jgi:hypothetical protein
MQETKENRTRKMCVWDALDEAKTAEYAFFISKGDTKKARLICRDLNFQYLRKKPVSPSLINHYSATPLQKLIIEGK